MSFNRITRAGLWVALVAAVVAGVAAVVLLRAGDADSDTALERWIGGQLKRVVNGYLNPTLDFDGLDYRYPQTVVVTGVRLEADDPGHASGRSVILTADRIELTLDRIPKQGEPIVIRDVAADAPAVRLLTRRTDAGVGLVGYSDLVRGGSDDAAAAKDAPPLSDVFRMQRVAVRDGAIEYDPRTGSDSALRLDGISTTLSFEADDAGWYTLALKAQRAPVFDLSADGRLNLDTLVIELARSSLTLDLATQQHALLPKPVAALLERYEARGTLSISAAGTLPIQAIDAADLRADLALRDAHFASGDYQVPVDALTAEARAADGVITLTSARGRAMGGAIEIAGTIGLNAALTSDLHVTLTDLHLEKLVRGGEARIEKGQVSGLVNATAHLTTPLAHATTQATGTGQVDITRGRLAQVPVLGGIANGLASAAKASKRSDKHDGRDTASVAFALAGDHAQLTDIALTTPVIAAQGTGKVGFDESLYLDLQAGPLKKLADNLGALGKAINQITEGLTRYRVTGTLGEPKVDVLVLAAPDEKPTTDTPRQKPASEVFDDLDNNKARERQTTEEDDKWEQRREENRRLLGS